MMRSSNRWRAVALVALPCLAACSSSPSDARVTEAAGLMFLDGPADHVVGSPLPEFRVWVLDPFDRRATGIPGGRMSFELLGPDGSVLDPSFATVNVSFGQAIVSPGVTLDAADGYAIRARFEGFTEVSPPFSVVEAPDRLVFTQSSPEEIGVLADGANNVQSLFDNVYTTTSSTLDVGVFDSGGLRQSVAVFGPDRRPELLPITWTPEVDTLVVPVRAPIELPFTVWVIAGDFSAGQASVGDALAAVEAAWRAERAGISVGDVQFVDATVHAADWSTFALQLGAPFQPIADAVGRAAGRFNLYVVEEVSIDETLVEAFAENYGTAIAVAAASVESDGVHVLGHHLGHNFGLQHVPEVTGFLTDPNAMAEGVASTFLTEGQIFRIHFAGPSPVRALRDGDTFGDVVCEALGATTHCPALPFRIWNEGDPAPAPGATPRR